MQMDVFRDRRDTHNTMQHHEDVWGRPLDMADDCGKYQYSTQLNEFRSMQQIFSSLQMDVVTHIIQLDEYLGGWISAASQECMGWTVRHGRCSAGASIFDGKASKKDVYVWRWVK